MHGNTSCVWQKSKLNLILPNLPSACAFIIITRRQQGTTRNNGSSSGLKSTKFKRARIQRALELLMKTADGVWKPTQNVQIQLSQENLNQWPDEGDLATLNPALHIMERDEAGEIVMDVENTDGNTDINQNTSNINDEGPAPLQMGNRPLETFDGVINHNDSSIARCANAEMATSEITEVIERIHERGDVEQDGDANLNNDHSEANNIATFQQTDVLPIDGFANMNKTPYAWSRAFPTVFIPEYRIIDNEWKWVICHDITGWLCVR